MLEFIKKNTYLIILFIITLSIGFLTFLTFIDKGFIELTDKNLQYLLVLNIILLASIFLYRKLPSRYLERIELIAQLPFSEYPAFACCM